MRDETKPADREPINTPTDPERNMEPAWLWDSPNSLLMAGIRGAKINRAMKVRKNSSVREKILPMAPLNGSGTGQSLISKPPPSERGGFHYPAKWKEDMSQKKVFSFQQLSFF